MPSYLCFHQALIIVMFAWVMVRLPPACWLRVHVTTHANWRFIRGSTWAYGEYVSHLIDFDVASQILAFAD